jgi:uncharacterized protein YeaO (DUF488 family)
MIKIKRVYDAFAADDGHRFLVDRLWPRGFKKENLPDGSWMKEAAPSNELRKWYEHDPAKWDEFCRRYFAELDSHPDAWQKILETARQEDVTLLYSAREFQYNNAVALRLYLNNKLK